MNGLLPALAILMGALLALGGIVLWIGSTIVGTYRRRRAGASRSQALVGMIVSGAVLAAFVGAHAVGGDAELGVFVALALVGPAAAAAQAWWRRRRTPLHEQLLPSPALPPDAPARPAPNLRGARRARLTAVAVLVAGLAVVAAGTAALVHRPGWTGIVRAEAIQLPARDGVPASLEIHVWLRSVPPANAKPWIWVELWSRGRKQQVVHAAFGPQDTSGGRNWSTGDLFDPTTRAFTALPGGTHGSLSGVHAVLHVPLEGLRGGIDAWRVLTLAGGGGGDTWPDVESRPASLATPGSHGTVRDITLAHPRARIAGGVLRAEVDVSGDVPSDAGVTAELSLADASSSVGHGNVIVTLAPTGSGWTVGHVILNGPGGPRSLDPPLPKYVSGAFDGRHITLSAPVSDEGVCCYRIVVLTSSPSGGFADAALPALDVEPPLPLDGHALHAPKPGVTLATTAVALESGGTPVVRGTIALRRDPGTPGVAYIVRILAANGGLRATVGVVFGPLRGGRRLPTQAVADLTQGGHRTHVDLLATHPSRLALSFADGVSQLVVPLAGLSRDACCWTASVGALTGDGSPRGGFVDTPVRRLG